MIAWQGAAALVWAAETPAPTSDFTVGPGVVGFIAIFVLSIVTVLLILDMNRRVRRTRYRSEVSEALDREASAEVGGEPTAGEEPNETR